MRKGKKKKKKKKWKQPVKKPTTHVEQKLNSLFTSSLLILLLFKDFFISLFSASHDILKTRVFRNNTIPLRLYLL